MKWVKGWCQMLCQNRYFHSIAGATNGIAQNEIISIMTWLLQHAPYLQHMVNDSKYQLVIQNAVRANNRDVLQWFLTQQPKYMDLTEDPEPTVWIKKMNDMFKLWWDCIQSALHDQQLSGALWVWDLFR